MFKLFCTILFFQLFSQIVIGQQFGTLIDERDGKNYNTIKIGNQVWMAGNLNVSTFLNGDTIFNAKTNEQWKKAGINKQPAWCYYQNDSTNGLTYGKLYNWYAVNDARGLAPKGWHIPSDFEWTELTDFLGGTMMAGSKLKINNDNISQTGFNALMAGDRHHKRSAGLDCRTYWWSSTRSKETGAWLRQISCSNDFVERLEMLSWLGISVRCIKNRDTLSKINATRKIYLIPRNLGFQIFDVNPQFVSKYNTRYFALNDLDVDSLRLNLEFLSSYLLNESNRSKFRSFELRTSNTIIEVSSITKPYGDWFSVVIKSNHENWSSEFIISDGSPKKYVSQNINNLIAYLNYHLPVNHDHKSNFSPKFFNLKLK